MRKRVAIYGAGGFGRETALMISQINEKAEQWEMVGFFDDGIQKGKLVDHWPVLGGMNELNAASELSIVLAVADPGTRKTIHGKIRNDSLSFPTLVHPMCLSGDKGNVLMRGSILTAYVVLTTSVTIGEFAIVNLACTLGHDVQVGAYSSLMPGCSVSGNVKIGTATLIGTGAMILQNLSIGSDCKVGAGAVVTHDVPSMKKVIGVPAREM